MSDHPPHKHSLSIFTRPSLAFTFEVGIGDYLLKNHLYQKCVVECHEDNIEKVPSSADALFRDVVSSIRNQGISIFQPSNQGVKNWEELYSEDDCVDRVREESIRKCNELWPSIIQEIRAGNHGPDDMAPQNQKWVYVAEGSEYNVGSFYNSYHPDSYINSEYPIVIFNNHANYLLCCSAIADCYSQITIPDIPIDQFIGQLDAAGCYEIVSQSLLIYGYEGTETRSNTLSGTSPDDWMNWMNHIEEHVKKLFPYLWSHKPNFNSNLDCSDIHPELLSE